MNLHKLAAAVAALALSSAVLLSGCGSSAAKKDAGQTAAPEAAGGITPAFLARYGF